MSGCAPIFYVLADLSTKSRPGRQHASTVQEEEGGSMQPFSVKGARALTMRVQCPTAKRERGMLKITNLEFCNKINVDSPLPNVSPLIL